MKFINSVSLLTCLILGSGSHLFAQQIGQWVPGQAGPNASVAFDSPTTFANWAPAPSSAVSGAPTTGGQSGPSAAGTSDAETGNDNQWHIAVSPYLWIAGIHGSIGALDRNVGFKVSPSDLLSHARFGLLGLTEARRNKLITNLDLMYLRLGADNVIPFPPSLGAKYANFTLNVLILAPKVGMRIVDEKAVKVDILTGIRYWYFNESLSFNPSTLGLNFSRSQNWVAPLIGMRFEIALSPKIVTTIAGDYGGSASDKQDYQYVAALGYKIKPKLTLQAGYRYLNLNYQKFSRASPLLNLTMSGAFLGATYNWK
jgi:hypothetical protein